MRCRYRPGHQPAHRRQSARPGAHGSRKHRWRPPEGHQPFAVACHAQTNGHGQGKSAAGMLAGEAGAPSVMHPQRAHVELEGTLGGKAPAYELDHCPGCSHGQQQHQHAAACCGGAEDQCSQNQDGADIGYPAGEHAGQLDAEPGVFSSALKSANKKDRRRT